MKKLIAGFASGAVFGLVAATAAFMSSSLAASVVDVSPQARGTSASTARVVLDNTRVRVRDVTFPPGVTGMHTHEMPHVGIVIQGGKLVLKYPDGTSDNGSASS